jgi:hypothetical protein
VFYEKGLLEVGDGCFAYLQPDGGWGWSNAGLLVGDGQSLLIDTLFDLRLTAEMLEAMAPHADHAVSYRVSGFLKDVKSLISARSRLHGQVLDALHGGGIEIVSPRFMNQRALAPEQRFVADPALRREAPRSDGESTRPEDIVFDKAESAAVREQLRERHESLVAARAKLAEESGSVSDEAERERAARRIERLDQQIERLSLALAEESGVE